MVLLFIFLTTLAITLLVDGADVEPLSDLFQSLIEMVSVEWLVVPIVTLLLIGFCYILFHKLAELVRSNQLS